MSVYINDELDYLKLALDSIINQTIPCDIFIAADGGLSAKVSSYIEEMLVKVPERIFFTSRAINKGLAVTLNELIDQVLKSPFNYSFIARMDSDDICYPQRLEKQLAYFDRNKNVDICGTFCHEFGATFALDVKRLPCESKALEEFCIVKCPFIHPSVVFRREVLEANVRYPTNTMLTEDMALWFLLLSKGYSFGNVNEVLLEYRLNENTIYRRRGFLKGWSEFRLRFYYMFKLKAFSIKNILLIAARLGFHVLPTSVLKLAYKKLR